MFFSIDCRFRCKDIKLSTVNPQTATGGTGIYLYIIFSLTIKEDFASRTDRITDEYIVACPSSAERTEGALSVYIPATLRTFYKIHPFTPTSFFIQNTKL
ncbi:hypothetical protein NBG4_620022 [Candidatus Sulfobium mesophilum]|uniref:Uncharacterized protein n=1 Tax=Candidatus Sulfobium mesophilum TaxID=2016548 RepID=A0A2U3QJW8_9BACT|nr:hypothetical protein NBG4_620022 [Candidatus Sulfobium mesophilum]